MRHSIINAFTISLLLLTCFSAFAQQPGNPLKAKPRIVEVDAQACMGDDKSRKQTVSEALANAKRTASEMALSYVQSDTEMSNFTVEKDLVQAYTRAHVRVLEQKCIGWVEDPIGGLCYKIWIKAEVIPDFDAIKQARAGSKITRALNFNLNFFYRSPNETTLHPLRNGEVLQSGDHYRIIFSPTELSYVYIYQVDSADQVFRLFPPDPSLGCGTEITNPVQPGITYTLPGPDQFYALDKQTGLERIYVAASRKPNADMENLYLELTRARTEKKLKKQDSLQGSLRAQFRRRGVAGVQNAEESVDSVKRQKLFSAVGTKLKELTEGSFYQLEFLHQ